MFALHAPVLAKSKALGPTVIENLRAGGEAAGLQAEDGEPVDPRIFIANFFRIFLMAYGIIFIILMIYAGYSLITSHGEAEKEEKAHKTIRNAIIGLIILMSSYGLSILAAKSAMKATGFGSTPDGIDLSRHVHCCQLHFTKDGRLTIDHDYLDRDTCEDRDNWAGFSDKRGRVEEAEYLGYIPTAQCK